MLGHLSKENNFPELAYKTVMNELIENNKNFDSCSFSLSIAKRYEPSSIIELAYYIFFHCRGNLKFIYSGAKKFYKPLYLGEKWHALI